MRRIINTFKYGSIGVKLTLLATIICGLATVGLVVCAIIFGQLIWFFAAVFAGFITVSLAQTFGIQAGDADDDIDIGEFNNASDMDSDDTSDSVASGDTYVGDFMSERLMNPKSETTEANAGVDKKNRTTKRNGKAKSRSEIEESKETKEDKSDKVKKGKNKKNKSKKNKSGTLKNELEKPENKMKPQPRPSDKKEENIEDKNDVKKETKKEHEKKEHIKKEHAHSSRHKKAVVSPKAMIEKPKKVAKKDNIPTVKSKAKIDINYGAMLRKDIKDSKTEKEK
ncbi:MAG: hypothetical protein IJV15_06550 [Lachnospiraceae bacterium]|nr:hypothetical protein [Lachnospiraceae bacterium]